MAAAKSRSKAKADRQTTVTAYLAYYRRVKGLV
jgi:hypothetical protein